MTADQYQQLRELLLQCDPFESHDRLQALFTNPLLHAWKSKLPEANNTEDRVDFTIAFLRDRYNRGHENLLIVLLRVLYERNDSSVNSYHAKLLSLITALEPQLPLPPEPLPFSLDFVTVPAGDFLMGSRALKGFKVNKYEKPQHSVYLSAFQICKAPITNEQYAAFVQIGHRPPPHWRNGRMPNGRGNHPVVGVSWDDANAFCRWLSNRLRQFHRLPTEAEWEKVARGVHGQTYPWGEEWDSSKVNCVGSGPGDTTPIGQYYHEGDNPYGAVDLCGNVWEWCLDWFQIDLYASRQGLSVLDPRGPQEGRNRSVRGSAWFLPPVVSHPANRFSFPPETTINGLGFRCIREVKDDE